MSYLVAYLGVLVVVVLANRQMFRGLIVFALPASWVIWSSFTLVYTDWPDEGVRLMFKMWYPILLGVLAYFVCLQPDGLRLAKRWWYVGYFIATSVALARLVAEGSSAYGNGQVYRFSTFSHPSPFSFYMLVTFVLAYSLWSQRRARSTDWWRSPLPPRCLASMTRISIGALVLALTSRDSAPCWGFPQEVPGGAPHRRRRAGDSRRAHRVSYSSGRRVPHTSHLTAGDRDQSQQPRYPGQGRGLGRRHQELRGRRYHWRPRIGLEHLPVQLGRGSWERGDRGGAQRVPARSV